MRHLIELKCITIESYVCISSKKNFVCYNYVVDTVVTDLQS